MLSQRIDECFTKLEMKQADAVARLREEQATQITETVTSMVETALRERAIVPLPVSSPKVRSITEAASRKRASGGSQEIDKVIWPSFNTSMSVRQIATKANTSSATVGRSRKRWTEAQCVSATDPETAEHII